MDFYRKVRAQQEQVDDGTLKVSDLQKTVCVRWKMRWCEYLTRVRADRRWMKYGRIVRADTGTGSENTSA